MNYYEQVLSEALREMDRREKTI